MAVLYHRQKMKRLKDYNTKGDISELENIINPNARLSTTLDDILSVLSKECENYIEVGYGENLSAAYCNATISDKKCRLVHMFFSHKTGIGIHELHNFIKSLGNDVIFGFTYDDADSRVKLVMICN